LDCGAHIAIRQATALNVSRGRLAQSVERLLYTQDVGGSSPSPPTSDVLVLSGCLFQGSYILRQLDHGFLQLVILGLEERQKANWLSAGSYLVPFLRPQICIFDI
jgi:hypothetical protein